QTPLVDPPTGLFAGSFTQHVNREETGPAPFGPLLAAVNRARVSADSLEYPGYGYDRGVLPEGPLPDGAWERRGDVVEVRIPWNLVGVTDPSTRTVRTGGVDADGALATAPVEAIRLVLAARDAGGTWRMPSTTGAVA